MSLTKKKRTELLTRHMNSLPFTVRHLLPPALGDREPTLLQMISPFLPPPSQRPRPGNFTAFQMTTVLSTLHEASQASWGDHATSITSGRQRAGGECLTWCADSVRGALGNTHLPGGPAAPSISCLRKLDLKS